MKNISDVKPGFSVNCLYCQSSTKGTYDQFMNQHLLVKIPRRRTGQLFVVNLTNGVTRAGPMSEAIALGLRCDLRLDLTYFNCASE